MLFAGGASGRTLADNLLSFVDAARSYGLGGAVAGTYGDAPAIWLNPTAGAGLKLPSVTLCGQRGFIEDMTWQLLFVRPFGGGRVLGAGVSYYDTGAVALSTSGGESRTASGQQDFMGMANFGIPVLPRLFAGVSVKVLHSELVDEFSSTAAAVDAGLNMRLSDNMRTGVMLKNLGTDMRYREEEVPLPTAVGAGLSASRRLEGSAVDQIGVFTALADGAYVIEEGKFEWRGGLEYRWQESLAIRVGASRPADRNSWEYSSGLGVEVGAYRLDYATRFQSAEGAPHIFGLTVSL